MTEYRIVYRYKCRDDLTRYEETHTPQRKTWLGWRDIPDYYCPHVWLSGLERARYIIQDAIRDEREAQKPVFVSILPFKQPRTETKEQNHG